MKRFKRLVAMILIAVCVVGVVGCAGEQAPGSKRDVVTDKNKLYLKSSVELTGTSGQTPEEKAADEQFARAYREFAYRVFRECATDETMMVSPYSLYIALSMLINGTGGKARAELEQALGLETGLLNSYNAGFVRKLTADRGVKFKSANSIWIRDDFAKEVREEFLKTCGDYYRASVFRTDFSKALPDINAWTAEKTDNMIPNLLQTISPDTVMLLINAILFDGGWQTPFDKNRTKEEVFTHEDGTTELRSMMNGMGDGVFYETDYCTGFRKSYADENYSYIALLPKEGVTLDRLVASMDASFADRFFESAEYGIVNVKIPVYKEDYSVRLDSILQRMGVRNIFEDGGADFSGLTQKGNDVYVSQVFQKTRIEVTEEGVKAAAATVISVDKCSAVIDEPRIYDVYLDRPFAYMIVDNSTFAPIFIGTVR